MHIKLGVQPNKTVPKPRVLHCAGDAAAYKGDETLAVHIIVFAQIVQALPKPIVMKVTSFCPSGFEEASASERHGRCRDEHA